METVIRRAQANGGVLAGAVSLPSARPTLAGLRTETASFVLALLVLAYVLIVNQWVVDDAYITFRTVDNFAHGHGLTWNVEERVQAYTHPLWMFLMSGASVIMPDLFYASIVVSFVLSFGTVLLSAWLVTDGFRSEIWKASFLVVALLASKAYIDYTSSGLETPLSYLLTALFLIVVLRDAPGEHASTQRIRRMVFLASLSFVNRPDSLVFFLPPLAYAIWTVPPALPAPSEHERVEGSERSESKGVQRWTRVLRLVALASIPAITWVLFSLVYYGFPWPNTMYAKSLATDFPLSWTVRRGLEYTANSVQWDTASHALVILAAVLAWRKRSWPALSVLAGVALSIVAIVVGLASSTHMSGRHFAVPFFAAIVILSHSIGREMRPAAIAVALVAYILWTPVSALKFGTSAYIPYQQNQNYIDTKWYVSNEGAALLNWRPQRRLPDHVWYHDGEQIRDSAATVFVGVNGREAIGYAGYAAGPTKFIVDIVALSDPLLARLPASQPATYEQWKSGHFRRAIPAGYVESIADNENVIADEKIRDYYEVIRKITRGPLFRLDRLKEIGKINLGFYAHLVHGTYSSRGPAASLRYP